MTTKERQAMLDRFNYANVWLTRVYDPQRTDEHRVAIWGFLMTTADRKLKNILQLTRQTDEDAVRFWDTYGKN